jgi:hypothetical protein
VSDPYRSALVWYVAYGSNLNATRFRCYLRGGRPEGAARSYPGCRNGADPRDTRAIRFRGRLYFAGNSTTWGGGTAMLDTDSRRQAYGQAYLLDLAQLSDVVAQEMCRPTGLDLDFATLRHSGRHQLGPGRYETLISLGELDAHPLVTFTGSRVHAPPNPPSEAYLRLVALGLMQTHGLRPGIVARYLLEALGGRHTWQREQIEALCA